MPAAALTILLRGQVVARRALAPGERVVLGHNNNTDLRLDDGEASRRHVALELGHAGVQATDLGSKNGTRHGEERLPAHSPVLLPAATVIGVGDHEVRVELEGAQHQPSMRDEYEPLRELGRGANGTVFAARHRASGRLVAIKTLAQRLEGDRDARTRFLREARVRVDSPYVVPTYEAREEGGTVFLVMELVQGQSLEALLRGGPLEAGLALRIAADVAEGLSAAHGAGVVHRDVKPANVLLDPSGIARLADFGIARVRGAGSKGGVTRTGTGLGTLAYMAPEQAEDAKRAGPPADLYGLGAMLYHLLAGRPPFLPGPTILEQLFEDDPPPLVHFCPGCPPDAARLVTRLLEKDPDDRPPSAAVVATKLRALARRCEGAP